MTDLMRFGVSMEDALLTEFDRHIAAKGYNNRSEAVRDLVRAELTRAATADPDAFGVATLTLQYHHGAHQMSERLAASQHAHHNLILSTLHVHLDEALCFEVLVLRGRVGEIQALADSLTAIRGVTHGQLVMMDGGGAHHEHPRPHAHVHGSPNPLAPGNDLG